MHLWQRGRRETREEGTYSDMWDKGWEVSFQRRVWLRAPPPPPARVEVPFSCPQPGVGTVAVINKGGMVPFSQCLQPYCKALRLESLLSRGAEPGAPALSTTAL